MKSGEIYEYTLSNGKRYVIKLNCLRFEFYFVDGIRMSRSSAYRRGTYSIGEKKIYNIFPASENIVDLTQVKCYD